MRFDARVDFDAGDSALERHRTHLRLDDHYVRVLTLKEPPAQLHALLFQALYEVPSPLLLVSEWQRESPGAVRREIHARQRHFHNSKVSLTSYLGDQTNPADMLVDDSPSRWCVTSVRPSPSLSCRDAISAPTPHRRALRHRSRRAELVSAPCSKPSRRTTPRSPTSATTSSTPGWPSSRNSPTVRSMHLLFNTNYADLALLFSQDGGNPTNAHLAREALATLDTTHGTPYHLNLHVDDGTHLVLGATGAGKSFLLNFLIAQLQRYQPRTLIFDLGGSYARLTEHFGGTGLRLRLDQSSVTINPFCLEPTPANLQFLFTFVKVLIQAGGQHAMTRPDDQNLFEQIETLCAPDPEQRRLFTLSNILPQLPAQHLQRWVSGGRYAHVFDHVHDTVTLAPFQLVDFEGLDAVPLLLEPLLFYLLHRATATLLDPLLASTLKVFVIDEAWRFPAGSDDLRLSSPKR
ncbi:MAG: DUF87 domain-containing protein [Gemmatimonadaceae bacterium]